MKKWIFMALLIQLSSAVELYAQNEKMKALFLLNFTRNIGWPEISNNSQSLKILILDNKIIYEELNQLASRTKVGNRSIEVFHADACPKEAGYDVIYIGFNSNQLIAEVVKRCSDYPGLIVTDTKDGCQLGAGVNFVIRSGKLSYEIRRETIEKKGLRVASNLISLGIPIE
jgi:hypothetical protein